MSIFLILLLGLNIYASVKCVGSDYSDSSQKRLQLVLIWLLSVAGALLVLSLSRAMDVRPCYKTHDADPASPEKIGFGDINSSTDGSGSSD